MTTIGSSPSSRRSTPIWPEREWLVPLPGGWQRLIVEASACRICPGLRGSRPVLGASDGPVPAPILLIGEAPGRHGAVRTGVPLHGDRTGQHVEHLLAVAGVPREAVHRTNAVLCHPADERGRNHRPQAAEIGRCARWLAWRLQVVDPLIVVTLGAVPLASLEQIAPHGLRLAEAAGQPTRWEGRWLLPLYHPSPRALARRPMGRQEEDWRALGVLWSMVTSA